MVSLVFWYAIKAIVGLRVSKEEEEEGLDIGEHGQVAYIGFSSEASSRVPDSRGDSHARARTLFDGGRMPSDTCMLERLMSAPDCGRMLALRRSGPVAVGAASLGGSSPVAADR